MMRSKDENLQTKGKRGRRVKGDLFCVIYACKKIFFCSSPCFTKGEMV